MNYVGIDYHKKFSHLTAIVILGASLIEGPVSTIHIVSSKIMGVGAGNRGPAIRKGVAENIIVVWFITIFASGLLAGPSFFDSIDSSSCLTS